MNTNPGYQKLVRHDEEPSSLRELVVGFVLLVAVILACLLAPALPRELDAANSEKSLSVEVSSGPQELRRH
jgi:hypothetical protein